MLDVNSISITSQNWLEAVRISLDLKSDYAISKVLKTTPQQISNYKT